VVTNSQYVHHTPWLNYRPYWTKLNITTYNSSDAVLSAKARYNMLFDALNLFENLNLLTTIACPEGRQAAKHITLLFSFGLFCCYMIVDCFYFFLGLFQCWFTAMPLSPVSTYVHAGFAKFTCSRFCFVLLCILVSSNKLDWIGYLSNNNV